MINAIIDLYHKDSVDSWEAVKAAGVRAIIHKATQGTSIIDDAYLKRQASAPQHGLLWGAYHFGDSSDPVAQADHFLSVVDPAQVPLLVLDLEENELEPKNSMSISQAEKFVDRVQQRTGRTLGLYAGDDLRSMLNGKPRPKLAECWLWLADWRDQPRLLAGWEKWTLWQYSDGGHGPEPRHCNGVATCNRSQFNGTEEQLAELFAGKWAGFSTPAAVPA
jgi:lysozyme